MNRVDYIIQRISYFFVRFSNKNTKYWKNQPAIWAFDNLSHRINCFGLLEIDELNAIVNVLRKNQFNTDTTVVDVGANIGNHSVFFADIFRNVVAFEASRKNFELCNFNCAHYTNITCENLAVSNISGYVNLTNTDSLNSGKGSISEPKKYPVSNSDTFCICLDDYNFSEFETIGLIKIDVEGAELSVLKGARTIIRRDKPIILFEENYMSNSRKKSSGCIDYLLDLGYKNFYVPVTFLTSLEDFGRKFKTVKFATWLVEVVLVTCLGAPKTRLKKLDLNKVSIKDYSLIIASSKEL